MADPVLEFRDGADVLVSAGSFFDFGTVTPGTPTAAVVRNLWNGFGLTGGSAVDTAQNIAIVVEARLTATGGQWLGADGGIGLLDSLSIEVQLPDISRYAGWTPVGSGIFIRPGDLATDSKHAMNVRTNLPSGAAEVGVQFKIGVDFRRTIPLPGGYAAHEPGISRGVGKGTGAFVFSRDGAFSVSGTGATSTVRWPTYAWYILGRPLQELGGNATSGDEVLSNLDGSLVVLGAGKSYLFLTTLQGTGRAIVKGDLVTGTAAYPTDAPAIPADSVVTGWGIRFADADALAPQHTELTDATPKCHNVTTSGLSYTVEPAGLNSVVHGRLNDNVTQSTGTFPGDGTFTVWLLPDGSVDDSVGPDGASPQEGSMRLFDIVIALSLETSRIDYRRWRDKALHVDFDWISPVAGGNPNTRTWRNNTGQRLWRRPEGDVLELDAVPGAGNVQADVFVRPAAGGAPVTSYTSSGTDDRRPTVTNGDADRYNAGEPEALVVEPNDTVEVDLNVTTATPASANLSLVFDLE